MRRLPFLVGIVIPSRGGPSQARLSRELHQKATRMVLEAFEGWFGGATPMKVPPGGIVRLEDGTTVFDSEQTFVVAGTTRREFRRNRERIVGLAERIGESLGQESMAVLAFPTSESMLIFPESGRE